MEVALRLVERAGQRRLPLRPPFFAGRASLRMTNTFQRRYRRSSSTRPFATNTRSARRTDTSWDGVTLRTHPGRTKTRRPYAAEAISRTSNRSRRPRI
jgi:hypothetical protein